LGTLAIASVSVSPNTVLSEMPATGTVTLTAPAPAGGLAVSLWTTGAIAYVPQTVSIPAGATTATFTITTNYTTTTQQDTITAFYNGDTKTAGITVTPPLGLASVSVAPASIVNQKTGTGTVSLSAPAPAGGTVVYLWTTGAIAYVPQSVTVPAGATSATFTVTTNYTTTTRQDTVTAFYNGQSKTAAVTVTP
jgi:hypothetical protein